MSKIKIVTDSTADIPQAIREQLGIEMVPLKVHFGDETFLDSVNLSADKFYEKLVQAPELPTTSQPSPVEFQELYTRLLADPGTEIISIHVSSALSGTYQSALLAKSLLGDHPNITIVDSKSASYGMGLLVAAAAEAAAEGKTAAECLQIIAYLQKATNLYFLVDTLEYLKKGGRIGKASAVLGSLLNVKPILSIDEEGAVFSIDKVRGQKKAMARIVEMLKENISSKRVRMFVAHANAQGAADDLVSMIQQHFDTDHVMFTSIGPVVGTHVGPGTVGVFVCPE